MKTVLEPLDAALTALNAEIRRLTIARDDVVSLIDQMRDPQPAATPPPATPARPPKPSPRQRAASPKRQTSSSKPNTAATHDYQTIANDILAARRAGNPVRAALAGKYGVPGTTVANWMTKCRKLGLIDAEASSPPSTPSTDTEPAPANTRSVYRCGEMFADGACGVEVESIIDITTHTLSEHGRRPAAGETHPRHPGPVIDADRPDWQRDALCNTGDAVMVPVFFGRGRLDFDGARAKRVCVHCPVQPECLDYALTHIDSTESEFTPKPHDSGVWGGLTGAERRALRRDGAA